MEGKKLGRDEERENMCEEGKRESKQKTRQSGSGEATRKRVQGIKNTKDRRQKREGIKNKKDRRRQKREGLEEEVEKVLMAKKVKSSRAERRGRRKAG